jgi:hypothetical protein
VHVVGGTPVLSIYDSLLLGILDSDRNKIPKMSARLVEVDLI